MPKQLNGQLYSRMASRFWFRRDPLATTHYPVIELGLMPEAASPTNNVETEELRDPASNNAVVWEVDSSITEEWTLKTANQSMVNFAMYFNANPPVTTTRAATAQTDVSHANAVVGGLVKVYESGGNPAYNLTSIDAVKIGATTLVEDTDYEVVDLLQGMIRLLVTEDTGDVGDAVTLLITITPVAFDQVELSPQTVPIVQGMGFMQLQSPDGSEVWQRFGPSSLRSSTTNFSATTPSDIDFTLKFLTDPNNTASPAGKLMKVKGASY